MNRHVENLGINFIFQSPSFFIFDLTVLKHLIDVVVLVHQQIILGPSTLNFFANLREYIFKVLDHMLISLLGVDLSFFQNPFCELFVFDDHLNHAGGLGVSVHKVNCDVVDQTLMLEESLVEKTAH
jgi:hypothetical protein